MGHVDGRGRLALKEAHGDFHRYAFEGVPTEMTRYLVKKGSIAVNGVSLTLNAYSESGFEVMLIPHTLERTNLGALSVGAPVNLEYDWLTKVILEKKPWNLS
jgi:riboflavin synthase